jgi:hypothetical protein
MYFPEDLLVELKKQAKEKNTTISDIVRKAVIGSVRQGKAKDWECDSLWNMVGAGESAEGDLSVNHDQYLYGGHGD